MKIFKDKHALQREILENKGISFIPTMGGLHKGHISLIKRSKKSKFKTLVTIFVNPKQFNNKNDFDSYPRNTKEDIKILKKLKINYLYIPTFKDVYGFNPKNKVFLHKFSKELCGRFRKSHFKGVLNVVNRFLEIINPKLIYLGTKDYQQLYLIKKHIKKRKIKTKIIECKTVRELNGVACSSRNSKLNQQQKKIASNIFYYLFNLKKKIKKNYNLFKIKEIKKNIISLGAKKIDYIENYDIESFKRIKGPNKKFNLFIAYHIQRTRLIDNI